MRIVAALAALALSAVVSSCGGLTPTDEQARNLSTGSVPNSRPVVHNAQDVAFAQRMIPHHQQALEMAALVPTRSTNPQVLQVATSIAADQKAEIQTMTAMLAQWGAPVVVDTPPAMGMNGMVDSATMEQLRSLGGAAFDMLWVRSMITHHQGAITMANAEIAGGQSQDAIKLATLIVAAQQREISYMTSLVSVSQ